MGRKYIKKTKETYIKQFPGSEVIVKINTKVVSFVY